MTTLTRAEALQLIEDCETFSECCDLCAHWIGNDSLLTEDNEAGTALTDLEGAQEVSRDYVAEACVCDDTRSRGHNDDDDTSLTAPCVVQS